MFRVLLPFVAVLFLFSGCQKGTKDPCTYCVQKSCTLSDSQLTTQLTQRLVQHYRELLDVSNCLSVCKTRECQDSCQKNHAIPGNLEGKALSCAIDAIGGTCSKACGIR